MRIRCTTCTKTIVVAPTGALPPACPHCAGQPVPARLGPFVPVRLVATGGMGEVYLARHAELGTEVAIKLLPAMAPEALANVRERFARELRLTARVQHPGVVKVLDGDVTAERPYLVLEFVDGATLRERLAGGPLPLVDAACFAAATADVLAAAHQQGVLHRDVKPDNVMVARNGAVRVLDFGIARAVQDDAPLTRTGEIVGTPEYMAPEQLLDGPEATDERTDVHALGVLLYELLTGRSPFHGANVFQALKLVEALVPPAPSTLRAGVLPALDAVVARALQKLPGDRFAAAQDFADAVRTAVPAAAAAARARPQRRAWHVWLPLAALLPFGLVCVLAAQHWLAPAAGDNDGATGGVAARIDAPATNTAELAQLIDDGRWTRALLLAERAVAAGNGDALAHASLAFSLHHHAWPLACGLPPWLAACDERQRRRLFRDDGELPRPGLNDYAMILQGLTGPGLRAGSRKAAGVVESNTSERLLAIHAFEATERAAKFAEVAARLPLDEPEHWLARRAELAFTPGASANAIQHAAEMAWLTGAGELAVLLDAGLIAFAPSAATLAALSGEQRERLLRRVAAADADDSPASTVLQVALAATAGTVTAFDPRALAALPAEVKPFAAQWLVAAGTANPTHRTRLLRAAVCGGAVPDYNAAPWSDLSAAERADLDTEAQRGR